MSTTETIEYFNDLADLYNALEGWNRKREVPVGVPDPEDIECPACGRERTSLGCWCTQKTRRTPRQTYHLSKVA